MLIFSNIFLPYYAASKSILKRTVELNYENLRAQKAKYTGSPRHKEGDLWLHNYIVPEGKKPFNKMNGRED